MYSTRVMKFPVLMMYLGPAGLEAGDEADAAEAAAAFSLARFLTLRCGTYLDVAFASEDDVSPSRGKPSDMAVEAGHPATESVSSLYCWYVLTSVRGSILTRGPTYSVLYLAAFLSWSLCVYQ